jgi:hypothetical protein
MPPYFAQAAITLPFKQAQDLLSRFVGDSVAAPINNGACKLDVRIDIPGRYTNPVVDTKWLVAFLLKHPDVQINFLGGDSFNWEANNLKELVHVIRSTPKPTSSVFARRLRVYGAANQH